ncbi:MAG: ABC transporter permease [Spirochaetes bacterium]|nr:ABC transporter permease [Spirochaetota bacterium]
MRQFGIKKKQFTIAIYSGIVIVLFVVSFFPEHITGYPPHKISFTGALPPSFNHLAGTDYLGRDILSRTIAGARLSFVIGAISRISSVAIGLVIGIIAGMSPPLFRQSINFFIEVFLSIPALILALTLAMVLGESRSTIFIAIVVGTWAPVARYFSTYVANIRVAEHILSAHAIGAHPIRIALFHIFPVLLPSLIPLVSTGIASSIMLESTLSFLGIGGVGTLYELPSWGVMIQEGSRVIFDAPWMLIAPSIFLTTVIICFNRIGDAFETQK